MSAQPQHWLTPEEYLEFERAAEIRHEYYNGRMYAIPGVTTSDLRLRVAENGLYTYPDISVIGGEPKFATGRTDTVLNPTLIIEVLSPSTELIDREFKAAQYKKIESLREYALVSQVEARVEVYRRQDGGQWMLSEVAGLEAAARFESIEASVPLAEIYAKVQFGPEEA